MTYDEFNKVYKGEVENFIEGLNEKLGTNLTYRDFDDHFYKMESTVISEVEIDEE